MRFLVRLLPRNPDRSAALAAIRSIAANLGGRAVNPKWTTYGALELDIFAGSREDFDLIIAAVAPLGEMEFITDLQRPPGFLPKGKAVEEAVLLFNGERFWEAHEVLESLWRVAEGYEKRLLQGLILVCAAFVHVQKGENEVALGVAARAAPLLAGSDSVYYSVDVASVGRKIGQSVTEGKLSLFKL